MTLLQQATMPTTRQVSPGHAKQTPMLGRSNKAVHPLYGPASVSRQGNTQRKTKQKPDAGFAIRQPTSAASAKAIVSRQVGTQPNALRHLLGAASQHGPAAIGSTMPAAQTTHDSSRGTVARSERPIGAAALLGVAQPAEAAAFELIDPESEGQDAAWDVPKNASPCQPVARRQSLLDAMIEGELAPDEMLAAKGNIGNLNASTPMLEESRGNKLHQSSHVAHTPSMMLQRQFIAKLQNTPLAACSQVARPAASSASLSARLASILQHEKDQRAHFEATGCTNGETVTVTIVQQQLEGHIVKCRCHKMHDLSDHLFVIFNNKMYNDVSLHVGTTVKVHAPWTTMQVKDCSIPVLLCFHATAC